MDVEELAGTCGVSPVEFGVWLDSQGFDSDGGRLTDSQVDRVLELWRRRTGKDLTRAAKRSRWEAYQRYLHTPEWETRRDHFKEFYGNRCMLCGNDKVDIQIHHNNYRCLGAETYKDCVALCDPCHVAYHAHGSPMAD